MSAPERPDVVVVGAGITGASIARHLAAAGASVVVLERGRPASGATGRSGGMVRAYDPDPAIAELALPSLAVYRDPANWASGRSPLRAVGSVTAADPAQEAELRAEAARITAALGGSAHVVAGPDEAAGVRLAGGIALVEPEAGWVDPAEVTGDWLAQARALGASVRTGTPVRAVTALGGRPVVHTDDGELRAGTVVAATGPWAADPVPGLRPAHPVRARSIQVSVVERGPDAPPHATFVDLRTGRYAKPVGADRTLLGMPHLVWDCPFDAPADPEHERATTTALATHLPWVALAAHVATTRATDAYGAPAHGPSGLLESTGVPHAWSVRGWNGGGVKTAPEAGRRIALACLSGARTDVA
ncbi:FAD-binding oxidoreductase [Actinosynnema pretiosum subsp. pretiosum]|uniref:FAD-binding oxidoreductase n=1 Tax=Actinosynnema pretiosum subsp. pretiosum TaxID=103721 RepID=A0AA45R450_9PSEU|nr:FAD dependent oxidoreductase [Actinosynnema pretiosum subsp. pretiosum]QUF04414.1 FAD-binding oxidoreductase [Actinosynnema pretiosum subsp. pretiosum]